MKHPKALRREARALYDRDADADAGQPGAARALVKAGWLLFDERGCTVANWERHCGSGAKRRAVTAERVWRHRQHVGNTAAPSDVTQ